MELLDRLHDAVQTDQGPAGMSGTLAIAVCEPAGTRWWQVFLDPMPRSRFLSEPPLRADAVLMIGVSEARALLKGVAFPKPPLVEVLGDAVLVRRVLDRYLGIGGLP